MKSLTLMLLALLVFTFALPGRAYVEKEVDPFDMALEEIGLTKETLTFDYGDMSNYGGDRYFLPLFYTLHSSPFKVEHYSKVFRDGMLENCESLAWLVAFGSSRINEGIRRGLIADPLDSVRPLADREDPLYSAIRDLQEFLGAPIPDHRGARLAAAAAEVPAELQSLAAVVILAAVDSLDYHELAFERAAHEFDLVDIYGRVKALATDEDVVDRGMERFIDLVDFKYLYTPSQDIAMAVDFVADSLANLEFPEDFGFEWPTALGKIVLSGAGNDEYEADDYFLIIDVGGDDLYRGGAVNRSPANWVSILIDASGDDVYESDSGGEPAFGAGILGYAYLVDLAGSDKYGGGSLTQGVGLFGVGALLDRSGDDTYDAYIGAQGAGIFGIGVLSDMAGGDKYHCYQMGQGYGFTKGIGMLVDKSGDDHYVAEDEDIVFPSPQTEEHNANLAQGVGFGKRADFVDGHSWAGGHGFLIDGAGDDIYDAGLFAQGCAYWYAIGLLSDMAGNDEYNGIWYVQGSGAHFGLGILLESGGDDVYNAEMNMAQGAGHDFTLGLLIDEAGDDVYNAPNLSLGGGNANGIGMFWDKTGDDVYNCAARLTLGRANGAGRGGLRDHINTIGFFLDTGGNDIYPLAYPDSVEVFKNDHLWTRPGLSPDDPLPTELGVGYDREW
ncbi:MAG: hypothetical protein PVF95_03420 [bacterium]